MSGAANGDAGGDDSEDSSFPDVEPIEKTTTTTTADMLEEFRERWQQELISEVSSKPDIVNRNTVEVVLSTAAELAAIDDENQLKEKNDEDQARTLFTQATEFEKLGKVFDAMHLYRRAVQMVPDIEFKMYETTTKLLEETAKKENQQITNATDDSLNANDINDNDVNDGDDVDDEDDDNLDGIDLMNRFQMAVQRTGRLFQRATRSDKNVISTGLHFSDMPMEIILYILKWVVSADLDLRSLDQCSSVSKGFYICAKDPDIWRLACLKIWGVQVGSLKGSTYLSWRHMYLNRHRVHFNGCYISKTSYLRYGENSFQDQFYRPIHLIEYFRYIRFFPDGHILMMTTPEDPAQSVGKLKNRNPMRHDVMKGHYRLHGDIVIIVLKRNRIQQLQHKHSRRTENEPTEKNHTFYLEFTIGSTAKRKFNQLKWKNYSVIQMKNKTEEVTSNFELKASLYPPLAFSRVKSYHSVSEYPLN